MGFELEKRLASELNRIAEDSSGDRDQLNAKPQKQVERIKRIAAELKERLLGGVQEDEAPGKRTAVDDAVASAVRKLEQIAQRASSLNTLPFTQQRAQSFDDYRARGLREVLDVVRDRKLRDATIASASPSVTSRTGVVSKAQPNAAGQAMWRAAERRAATLYRHAQDSGEVATEDPVVDEALARVGSGEALPTDVRKQMERELGISLARVRVHTDPVAAAAAKAVRASAFTVGEDIFFANNAFSPTSREGKKLLAHELTHVVQAYQGRTKSGGSGIGVSHAGESLEVEADAIAERIVERPTKRAKSTGRGAQNRVAKNHIAPAPSARPTASRQLLRKENAPESHETDPNKGVKPKLTFMRDKVTEEAKRRAAGPVQRVKDDGKQLAAKLKQVTQGPINDLKQTRAQVKAKPPGHESKKEAEAHKKAHKKHKDDAKAAAQHAKKHAKHADAKKHHAPAHVAQQDSSGSGAIQFKPISDWQKYMPEALPDTDEREKKRILGLVKKQVNNDRRQSAQLLNQLRKSQVQQAAQVRGMLPGLQSTVKSGTSAALGRVAGAEAQQTSAVMGAVSSQQAAVRSAASQATTQVNTAHTAAKAAIKAAHQAAIQFLTQSKEKSIQEITQAATQEATEIHNLYAQCKSDVIALGAAKAGEANGVPGTISWSYSGDKLEAAQKAAKDVASQYAEAMPSEASKAASKIGESEPDAVAKVHEIAQQNQEKLEEAFNQAKDALDQSMDQANTAADQIHTQAIQQISQTSSTTISQLAALGASQVAAIRQQAAGARSGIQQASAGALSSLASGVSNAASGIEKGAKGLIKGAKQVETASPEDTKKAVTESAKELQQGTKSIGAGLQKSASGAVASMNGQASGAATGMAQTAAAAKQSAAQMGQGATQAIRQAGQGASESLTTMSTNYKESADKMAKKAGEAFKQVVQGVKDSYTSISTTVTTNLNNAYNDVSNSFNEAVPTKETADCKTQGDKAAAAVKPWWQKALAFVASVVVAIVVSVVIVALVVTTGPVGAILVGAAAGALGSVAGQMASNLILGNGLMDGITWKTVAMGAIGGAVGAGFSQGVTAGAQALSAGGGRLASTGARIATALGEEGSSSLGNFAIKTGVGVAGDQVSDVASQLIVTGHYEFSMENLATSIVTNGLTSTKKYAQIESSVTHGLQNHVGHVEIGGANGAVSVHGAGSPVPQSSGHGGGGGGASDTGGATQVGASGPHPSGSSAGPAPAHGNTPNQGAHGNTNGGAHGGEPAGGAPASHGPANTNTNTGAHPPEHAPGANNSSGSSSTHGSNNNAPASHNHPNGDPNAAHAREPSGGAHNEPHNNGAHNDPNGAHAHDPNNAHAHEPNAPAHGHDNADPHAPQHQNEPHNSAANDPAHAHDQNAHGNDHNNDHNTAHDDHHDPHADTAHGDHENTAHGDNQSGHGDQQAGGAHANDEGGGTHESAAAGELADLGYPNATHEKAQNAAGAIESGKKPGHDTVRDTVANEHGLHELDRVHQDPNLDPHSKQNIQKDVAEHMRGEEPTGKLDHEVKQARTKEEERVKLEKEQKENATSANDKGAGHENDPAQHHLSDDEFNRLPPQEQMTAASAEIAQGAHTFGSQDAAAKWARENLQHNVDNLPKEHKDSIHNYTNEPGNGGHTGPTYKEMNSVLRADASGHSSPHDSAAVRKDIANVDAAMHANKLPETVTVVRGTGHSHLDATHPSELVGQTLTDHAYMSTSLGDNGTVAAFHDKEMILHLQVPAGHEAVWVETVGAFGGGERELLLSRGTSYEITRGLVGPDGKWHVYGRVIGGGGGGGGGGGAKGGATSGTTGKATTPASTSGGSSSSSSSSSSAPSSGGSGKGEAGGGATGGTRAAHEAEGHGHGDAKGGGTANAKGEGSAAAKVTHETSFDAPGDKNANRTNVGVGELVYFYEPEGASGGSWSTSAGTGATKKGVYHWTAPDTAQGATITYTPKTGAAEAVTMSVIAPTSVTLKDPTPDTFDDGVMGAGFVANVTFNPLNVSFAATSWKEDTGQAGTGASGYFVGKKLPVHQADPSWRTIGDGNTGPTDHAQFGGFPAPWTKGSFQWDIQSNYRVGSGASHKIEVLHQICTLEGPPSAGRTTVSKGGASTTRPVTAEKKTGKAESTDAGDSKAADAGASVDAGFGAGEGFGKGEGGPAGAAGGAAPKGEEKYKYPDSEKDDAAILKVETAIKQRFSGSFQEGLKETGKDAPIKKEEAEAQMREAKAQEGLAAKNQPDDVAKEKKESPPPPLGHPIKPDVKGANPPAPAKADIKNSPKGGADAKKEGGKGGKEHGGGEGGHVPSPPTPIVLRAASMGPAEVTAYLDNYPSKSPETTEKFSKIKEMSKVAQGFDGQVENTIAQNSGLIAGAQAKLNDFLGKKEMAQIFSHNPYEKVEGGLGTLMKALSTINNVVTIVGNVCTKLGMVLTVVGLLGMIFPPLGAAVSAVARVLNVVGLVCDVLGLALNGVLTGLNGMVLAKQIAKGGSNEEKAATADAMVTEATSAGGHVINLAMHYGPKFMKGFKSASKGVIGGLFAKAKSALSKWGTKALGPAANWAKNIGYKLGFGLKEGSGKFGKAATAVWKSPGTLLEKVRETSLVRKINNSGFMQGLEKKSASINGFMDGKGGFLSKTTNIFENGSEKIGGAMGSGVAKGSNAIAHKVNADWEGALKKSVENDEKAIAQAAEKHAAANAANREGAKIDRDINKARKAGQDKFDEAFNPKDASVDRKIAAQGTAKFDEAEQLEKGKAGAVSAAEQKGGEDKRAQLEAKKEAHEKHEAKEKKEARQIDEFKKDPEKFQSVTERFQNQQEKLEQKLANPNLSDAEKKQLEAKAEEFKKVVADRQTIGAKASGFESPENIKQALHSKKEFMEALHGKNERVEWQKEGQEKGVDEASGHKFHEKAEKEERRHIIGELEAESKEAPTPTTAAQVDNLLDGLDEELGLEPDAAPGGGEPDADHADDSVDAAPAGDVQPDAAPDDAKDAKDAKEPQADAKPQPGGDQGPKDKEQTPEIPELSYWPKLTAPNTGDFAQAAADLHRMKQVAYGFYKAQGEAKKKARETAFGLATAEERATFKQQEALAHAAKSQETTNEAGKSATAASTATNEGSKGEGAQNDSKKSANGSAQEAPDPGEIPSRWHPIKRIWWHVKKWAADKAAKVFGWVQEKIANLVLNAICGVSMGDMKAYTTALHHRMQFSGKVGGQAQDAAHKANEEAGKTKETAKSDAAQAMADAAECDQNMQDADAFIKSVDESEQQMVAEQARAAQFLSTVYAAVADEKKRKEEEAAKKAEEQKAAAAASGASAGAKSPAPNAPAQNAQAKAPNAAPQKKEPKPLSPSAISKVQNAALYVSKQASVVVDQLTSSRDEQQRRFLEKVQSHKAKPGEVPTFLVVAQNREIGKSVVDEAKKATATVATSMATVAIGTPTGAQELKGKAGTVKQDAKSVDEMSLKAHDNLNAAFKAAYAAVANHS